MTSIELDALAFSARIAAVTVLISFPLAMLAASWAGRRGLKGRWVLDAMLLLPLGVSPAVIGWGVVSLLGPEGPTGDWLSKGQGWQAEIAPQGLVLVAFCLVLPLMIRTMRPAFEAVDLLQLQTARTLGATRWSAWWSVTVAQTAPMLLSAAALGFAAAWGESGASVVLAAALQARWPQSAPDAVTVPLTLLSAMQTERGQDIAFRLSMASLGVALAAMLLSEWARQRWRRRALPLDARGVSR